jgi:inositol 1,4,5-triphosphate receptor type 3
LLDVICGSTTGGLGLLGLYINENNVALINQILEALTEYCQVNKFDTFPLNISL